MLVLHNKHTGPNGVLNDGENGTPSKELEPPVLTLMVSPTENVASIKAHHSPSNGKGRTDDTMSRAQRAANRGKATFI